ncbi:hypothetical protein V8E54_003239 [Elaphomyces granulatus]
MESVEELLKANKPGKVKIISRDELDRVKSLLDKHRTQIRRQFVCPEFRYALTHPPSRTCLAAEHSDEVIHNCFEVFPENKLEGFEGDYEGWEKTPDSTIFPRDTGWPTICLEVGYSETYKDLLEDASLLLDGSAGAIGRVILVKVEPLAQNSTGFTNGFVEVQCCIRYSISSIFSIPNAALSMKSGGMTRRKSPAEK